MLTTDKKIEELVAFISGDLLSMVIVWIHLDAADIIVKVAATGGLGLVGGFTGLLGKDIYDIVKNKFNKWRSKRE